MFFLHVFFALCIALLVATGFTVAARRKGRDADFLMILLTVFFGAWAGGLWLTPLGPVLWSAYWLPFFLVGLVFALILAAFPGPQDMENGSSVEFVNQEARRKQRRRNRLVVNIYFWVLLAVLVLAIVSAYVWELPAVGWRS